MTLSDDELKEEIKKVKLHKRKPSINVQYYVDQQYLPDVISRNEEAAIKFFNLIGEEPFSIPHWVKKRPLMAIAKKINLNMIKNPNTGHYSVFSKDSDRGKLLFDPKMLMT